MPAGKSSRSTIPGYRLKFNFLMRSDLRSHLTESLSSDRIDLATQNSVEYKSRSHRRAILMTGEDLSERLALRKSPMANSSRELIMLPVLFAFKKPTC